MKSFLLLLVALFGLLATGCSSGEVKAEDVQGYQEAGLKPGEKPVVATAGGGGER